MIGEAVTGAEVSGTGRSPVPLAGYRAVGSGSGVGIQATTTSKNFKEATGTGQILGETIVGDSDNNQGINWKTLLSAIVIILIISQLIIHFRKKNI